MTSYAIWSSPLLALQVAVVAPTECPFNAGWLDLPLNAISDGGLSPDSFAKGGERASIGFLQRNGE